MRVCLHVYLCFFFFVPSLKDREDVAVVFCETFALWNMSRETVADSRRAQTVLVDADKSKQMLDFRRVDARVPSAPPARCS